MRIYLDNCCYNRPYDNQSQQRINDETESIFRAINHKENIIIGSDTLILEMAQIKDVDLQLDIVAMYSQTIKEEVSTNEEVEKIADSIMSESSIHKMDALHLASAIVGKAEIFLTVDDKLIKSCSKLNLNMKVINPVELEE